MQVGKVRFHVIGIMFVQLCSAISD